MKNLIKVERARNNMSQSELAEKTGVSRQTIHAIETGKFVPSAVLAFKIAKKLNIQVNELFDLDEDDWKT